jgi:hypothetical protein
MAKIIQSTATATTIELTADELRVVRAALDDAWQYRLGEADGPDDPSLDEYDAAALEDLDVLPFDVFGTVGNYPSADHLFD